MIYLIPIGTVNRETLEAMKQPLENTFGHRVQIGDGIPVPEDSRDKPRRQHLASRLLAGLPSPPLRDDRVLGIVDYDIFAYGLNFVFGEADITGKRALISLQRLRPEFYDMPPDENLFLERILKEAIHELGHNYGLEHCPNPACAMRFSNSLQDTDLKKRSFCPDCRKKLKI